MKATDLLETSGWEDSSLTVMARIQGEDAANITQATIGSIAAKVFDLNDNNAQVGSTINLTVSSVVFDTLQTDARWTKDAVGYNFRHTVPASYFPTGDHVYRVEYKFSPSSGDPFFFVVEHTAVNVLSS